VRLSDFSTLIHSSIGQVRSFGQVGRARLETVRVADAAIAARQTQMSWSRDPAKPDSSFLELIYLNYED
jgi:hypothetical protein